MMRAHQWDNLLHDCRYIETQITLLLLVWVMHAVYTVHVYIVYIQHVIMDKHYSYAHDISSISVFFTQPTVRSSG